MKKTSEWTKVQDLMYDSFCVLHLNDGVKKTEVIYEICDIDSAGVDGFNFL
jgi:hypothetical protein